MKKIELKGIVQINGLDWQVYLEDNDKIHVLQDVLLKFLGKKVKIIIEVMEK